MTADIQALREFDRWYETEKRRWQAEALQDLAQNHGETLRNHPFGYGVQVVPTTVIQEKLDELEEDQ